MRSLVFSMRLTTRRLIGMTAFSWSSAAMVPSSQTESVSGLTSHKRYACGAYIHLSGNYRMTSERKAPYEKDPFTSQLRTRPLGALFLICGLGLLCTISLVDTLA